MSLQKPAIVGLLGLASLLWLCGRSVGDENNVRENVRESKAERSARSADDRKAKARNVSDTRDSNPRDGKRSSPPPAQDPGDAKRDERQAAAARDAGKTKESAARERKPGRDSDQVKSDDPEVRKLVEADTALEQKTRDLGREYRLAPLDQRDAIKSQLQGLVLEQFETRQQRRGLELKRVEDELKRIRDSIEKRNESKQAIVDRRLAELMGEEPEF